MTDAITAPSQPVPVTSRRLLGIDATRGLAFIGMMAVHVLPVADANGNINPVYSVAGGRSAATFAVLAGVGLALATGGTRIPAGKAWRAAAASVAARALAIGLIGLALGQLDSGVEVILTYYAVFFLLAIPLLGLGPRALAVTALVTALVVPMLSHAVRGVLLPEPDLQNPTFSRLLDDPVGLLLELSVTGFYPALVWVAYLSAGLAVGRLPLRSTRVAVGLLSVGVALAVVASLASWLLLDRFGGLAAIESHVPDAYSQDEVDSILAAGPDGTTPTDTWWWLAVDAQHSSTPLDLIHTTGVAIALLGALLLLTRLTRRGFTLLAAAGGMTLTLYVAHVALLSSPLLPDDAWLSYLLQVAVVLGIAFVWRRAVGRGPLEAIVGAAATVARRTAVPEDPVRPPEKVGQPS